MSEHYKVVCKYCGDLIMQCRCPALGKTIYYDVCESCKKDGKS